MNLIDSFRTYHLASGHSPRSVELRCYYVGRVVIDVGPLDQVTTGHLLAWLAGQHWAPETRKSARTALSVFYRWATDNDHLDHNPAARLPRVKVPAGVPHPVPDPVLDDALRDASDRDRLIVGLAAFAGLRRAEIAGLPWDGLEWSGLRVTGKGGRTRQIPLSPRLRSDLYLERGLREAGSSGSGWRYAVDPLSPFVFPGQESGHISADRVGRILRDAMSGRYSGHKLRHRFATKAYEVDRDLLVVQQLLGHSRPETTARYTAVPQGAAQRAVDGAAAVTGDAA